MILPASQRLHGLVAATHTPWHVDGSLNLAVVEKQAAHLIANKVAAAFIGGTTGESHSMTLEERRALGQRWMAVTRGTQLKVVVHVGSNCLGDAVTLARQAQESGASAISALAPNYFKPRSVGVLVECCAQVAVAAPDLPFYFYDIPSLTGVHLPMPEFLERAASRMPNFAGLKFTNPDLMAYQLCLRANEGAFDVPWGTDEALLGALAVGGQGGVGSSYNFAAPIYHRLLAAFAKGDIVAARKEQARSVQVIEVLARHGYMASAKAVMKMLGMDVGQPRLPNEKLTLERSDALRRELEQLGFFEWLI